MSAFWYSRTVNGGEWGCSVTFSPCGVPRQRFGFRPHLGHISGRTIEFLRIAGTEECEPGHYQVRGKRGGKQQDHGRSQRVAAGLWLWLWL